MFETAFQKFCKAELKKLLSEWDNDVAPSNPRLEKQICLELTRQFFEEDKTAQPLTTELPCV